MTDNKFTLRDITAALSIRNKMEIVQAEDFVRAFIETILQALRHEPLVKIKGLGTFKLITVDSRESINVNTGERITIEGHTKVAFTPDPALRDEINKPFADFQTTILNDAMDISLIGQTGEEQQQEELQEMQQEEQQEMQEEMQEDVQQPMAEQEEMQEAETEPVTVAEPETEEASAPEAEPAIEAEAEPSPEPAHEPAPNAVHQPRPTRQCHHILASICVLLLCALSYTAGYYRWFAPSEAAQSSAPTLPSTAQTAPIATPADTIATDTIAADTIMAEAPKPADMSAQYPQVPNAPYRIVGIKDTLRMKQGQSLRQISVKYYGSKDFVPYIVVLNDIKNPDVIPLGKELQLPELIKAE